MQKITSLFEIKFLGLLAELQDERTGCSPLLPVYHLIFIKILALSLFILDNFLCFGATSSAPSASPGDGLSVFIVISGEMINGGCYQVTMNTL